MPLTREAKKYAEYIDKVYRLIWGLQGTDDLEAYSELFPGTHTDAKIDYELLSNKTNRRVMVAIYKNRNLSIEQLAEITGLEVDDIGRRIGFFRANGMKQVRIRKVA